MVQLSRRTALLAGSARAVAEFGKTERLVVFGTVHAPLIAAKEFPDLG